MPKGAQGQVMSTAQGQRIVQTAGPGQKGIPQGATIVKLVNAQGQPVGQIAKPAGGVAGAVKTFAPGGAGSPRPGVQVLQKCFFSSGFDSKHRLGGGSGREADNSDQQASRRPGHCRGTAGYHYYIITNVSKSITIFSLDNPDCWWPTDHCDDDGRRNEKCSELANSERSRRSVWWSGRAGGEDDCGQQWAVGRSWWS